MKNLIKAVFGLLLMCGVLMGTTQARESVRVQGFYDGIYQLDIPDTYVTIQQTRDIIVAFRLDTDHQTFDTLLGNMNYADDNTFVSSMGEYSLVSYSYNIVFESPTEFTMTQISCARLTKRKPCDYENGAEFTGTKIF